MKKWLFPLLSVFLFIPPPVWAKEGDQVKLNLPWAQLQQLLKLNQDEVRLSWAEFQSLLQRTTQKSLPKYSVSNGDVLLSRAEFTRLVNSLMPPSEEPPTSVITKGVYKGEIVGESILVSALLDLQLNKRDEKPFRVELFSGDVAFREVLFDGRPALTSLENGKLYITTKETGHHTASLKYAVKNKDGNKNQKATFPIQRVTLTKVEFVVPERNVELSVDQALRIETHSVTGGTSISAVLPPADNVHLTWHTEVPQKEKGPAKIYVDGTHLIAIEEDALRVHSTLKFQVLKNSINSLSLTIPEGFGVIDVQGESLKEWSESGKENRELLIPFEFSRQGSFQLDVTCEQIFSENKVAPVFSGFKVKDATREKGFIGVELRTPAEASLSDDLKGLERIDVQELPIDLVTLSNRPLLFGFKYLSQPFNLGMRIERHNDVQLLSSVIDSASGVSWLMDDGKLVHQITYRLRNTWKQFMEVKLPEDAKLWSVFVGGQPAKPSENDKGGLLIPLNRSQNVSGNLTGFDVELVYYEQVDSPSVLGRQNFKFPIPDMIVSNMTWDVYLPQDGVYGYFGKELEKIRPIQFGEARLEGQKSGFFGRTRASRRNAAAPQMAQRLDDTLNSLAKDNIVDGKEDRNGGNDFDGAAQGKLSEEMDVASLRAAGGKAFAKNVAKKEKSIVAPAAVAIPRERGANLGRVSGVLPVRARIPVNGKILRFSKSLIVKDVPLQLPLYYLSNEMLMAIKILLLGIGFWFAYRFRRKVSNLARVGVHSIQSRIEFLNLAENPFRLVMVMAALCLMTSTFSSFLMILSLLAFTGALTRWLIKLIQTPRGGRL